MIHRLKISTFVIITLLSTICYAITDIYIPSLPSIGKYFKCEKYLVFYTLTTYLVSTSLSQLILGPLSDKFGRKNIIIWGLVVSISGTILCIMASSIYMLIVGRLIQGGGMGIMAVARSIILDVYKGRDLYKNNAKLSTVMPLIILLTPILGGYVEHYFFWRTNFVIVFLSLLSLIILTYFKISETNQNLVFGNISFKGIIQNYVYLLKNCKFVIYSLCASICLMNFIIYLGISSYILQNTVGLSSVHYGYLVIIICSSVLLAGICNNILLNIYLPQILVLLGAVIITTSGIISIILYTFFNFSVFSIMCPAAILSFGINIMMSNSFTSALLPFKKNTGAASALFGGIKLMGGSIGSFLAAILINQEIDVLGITYVVTGLFAVTMLIIINNKP